MTVPRRVLIAEDDVDIASTLSRGMERAGYEPVVAHDAASAMAAARAAPLAAAVVDMMLGTDRGEELVQCLRVAGMDGPILVLSALSAVEDRAAGISAGADDYIAKPFDLAELMTRLSLHAHLRAREPGVSGARPDGSIRVAGLTYDPQLREAIGAGHRALLTQREGELLSFLAQNLNRLVSRGEIFDTLWATEGGSSENVVDVYIGYLRRKLSPREAFGVQIRTVRGRGFMLTDRLDD
ncbi:response regulator transcription factor [Limibaculum sp. M0105]|uniref:Response regulator transcription factor n=1 Tax=Thermohalobaculum xanthum TaxID=2753746 RepID=A0A8J7M7Z3_9RHOB|nr:response regulator transcription factor [Thermohalobaculum xanthum]MBK0399880.1 response regulator transcription factor [Thermohalobaculum xanthum]